jgi:uncharacterized protein
MKIVPCPRCAKEIAWSTDNKWRPFCSERCKMVDFGAWANEEYRVAGATPSEGFDTLEIDPSQDRS